MRYGESFFPLTPTIAGLLISIPDFSLDSITKSFYLITAVYFFCGHVHTFNEYSGFIYDKSDKHKHKSPLISGKISKQEEFFLSFILLIISFIVLYSVKKNFIYLLLLNSLMWLVYSHPKTLIKGIPVAPTMIHFIAAIIHFIYGYLLFPGYSLSNGLLIGSFFGLIFSAGHLNHELKDYENDKSCNFNTSAVTYGKKNIFLASFILLTLSTIYFFIISFKRLIPNLLYIPLALIYPVYLYFAIQTYKNGINHNNIFNFRTKYRILYISAGIFIVVQLLISKI